MSAPTAAGGRRMAGFGNQARRELDAWLTTGRWRRQALAWTAILGGLFVLMHWVLPTVLPDDVGAAATPAATAMQFTEMAAIVTSLGVVLLASGVLVDERRNGVLEWLLSKPLTRPALITAKFVGQGTGLLLTAVALPWVAVYVLLGVAAGRPWPVGPVVATAGMVALLAVFHLALVLALSTFTQGRIAVLAVPLVLIVGADLVTAAVPWLFDVLPWSLARLAGAHLAEGMLVTAWPVPATAAWTLALVGAAAWRLTRTEL